MANWTEIEYFNPDEFDYPDAMDDRLMRQLDSARKIAGTAFVITSDYRPSDDKAHGRGKAVDIRCSTSGKRIMIVGGLLKAGFRRIGVYDKHIHADVDETLPQDVMWVGRSK